MSWFIVQSARKTLTIYLVEADNEQAARESYDDREYLGFFDDETLDLKVVGPFQTQGAALSDDSSYVDGR